MAELIHGIDRRPLTTGKSLFDYADEVALAVPQSCGRSGRCRECVVEIRQGGDTLSPRTEAEEYLPPGFRLACQALIESADQDVEFAIIRRRMHILEEAGQPITEVDPIVSVSGHGREVRYDGITLDHVRERVLGLAVDVGTTSVAAYLCDLATGEVLNYDSMMNPQVPYGEDVMSRITYAMSHEDGIHKLQDAIIEGLNTIAARICVAVGFTHEDILELAIVFNTAMHHCFLGIYPEHLGLAPYAPALHHSINIKARDLGLPEGDLSTLDRVTDDVYARPLS